jgi:hypothetical protein
VTIITFNVIFNFSIKLIYEKLFNTPNIMPTNDNILWNVWYGQVIQ